MAEINDERLERFFELIGDINEALTVEEREKKRLQKEADERRAKVVTLFKGLGDSLSNFGKAISNSDQGFSKFSGSVNATTDAVAGFASNMGPAGKAVAALTKVIGGLVTLSFEQNDKLLKAYQGLSRMGSVTTGGLEELQSRMNKMGYTSEKDYEKFLEVLKPVTKEMALLGGSVTFGRDKLEQIFQGFISSDNQREAALKRLGYTTEEYQAGIAEYLQLQTRLGIAQTKTVKDLDKEAFKYLRTIKDLEEITGLTRDEQAKAREKLMSDARADLYYTKLQQENRGKEADNFMNFMVSFNERYGDEAAQGLQDLLMNQGRITTDAAAAIFQAAPNAYQEALKAMDKGSDYFNVAMKNIGQSGMNRVKQLEGTFMLQENVLKDMGLNNKFVIGSMKSMGINTDAAAKRRAALNNIEKKNGDMLEDNIKTEQQMRTMRMLADNMLIEITKLVTKAFAYLVKITYKLVKSFAKATDWFMGLIGKKTNFAAAFRDEEDIVEDLKASNDIILAKEKIISEKEKQLAQVKEGKKVGYEAVQDTFTEERSLFDRLSRAKTDAEKDEIKKLIEYNYKLRTFYQDFVNKNAKEQKEILEKDLENEKKLLDAQKKKSEDLKKEKVKIIDQEKQLDRYVTGDLTVEGGQLPSTAVGGKEKEKLGYNAAGQRVDEATMKKRTSAAEGLKLTTKTEAKDIIERLNKKGSFGTQKQFEERIGGGDADPALVSLADKIISRFGGTITALNDKYHWKKYDPKTGKDYSRHLEGKALDFVLPFQPTKEDIQRIREELKDLGASRVHDEYFEDTSGSGRHLHVEVAKYGGLFSGPDKGYPVMLHGKNESAWPEAQLKSLLKDVQKSSLAQYKNQLMSEMGLSTSTTDMGTGTDNKLVSAFTNFSNKLDDVINRLERSNSIQDELLTYTRA